MGKLVTQEFVGVHFLKCPFLNATYFSKDRDVPVDLVRERQRRAASNAVAVKPRTVAARWLSVHHASALVVPQEF